MRASVRPVSAEVKRVRRIAAPSRAAAPGTADAIDPRTTSGRRADTVRRTGRSSVTTGKAAAKKPGSSLVGKLRSRCWKPRAVRKSRKASAPSVLAVGTFAGSSA